MNDLLESDVVVAATVDEVYRRWSDVTALSQLLGPVEHVRPIDEYRSRWTVRMGGMVDEFYVDLVDADPPYRIAWQSTDGRVHAGEVRLTPVDGGTRVRVRLQWELGSELDDVAGERPADPAELERDLRRFRDEFSSRDAPPAPLATAEG
ncbi:SRPBCC family protein [Microbacterium sp. NPDC055683]